MDSTANWTVIMAGTNPTSNNVRNSLSNIPGRFYKEGVEFTCDELPPAMFIDGGSNANTVCVLQRWQIFAGAYQPTANNLNPNPGKWPISPSFNVRQEQNFQAASHGVLRVSSHATLLGTTRAYTEQNRDCC